MELGAPPLPCDLSSSSQLLAPSLAARATVHAQPRGKVLKPLVSEFAQVVTVRGPSALLPSGSKLAAAFVLPPQVQAFPQVPCLPAGSKCIRAFPLGVDVGPTAPTKVLPTCASASASASAKVVPVKVSPMPAHSASPTADAPAASGPVALTEVLPSSASASASASAKVVPVHAAASPAHSASPGADAPAALPMGPLASPSPRVWVSLVPSLSPLV